MFDGSYHFQKVREQAANNKLYLESLLTFTFKTDTVSFKKNDKDCVIKGKTYIVEVEKYQNNIYVLKYYLKTLKDSPNKFNILTGDHKCSRIVGTCLQIILYIIKRDRYANFGFLGAHSIDPINNKEEEKSNTKRFRVYKKAMENMFGEESFSHFFDVDNSTYILLNNNNDNHEAIINASNEMFEYLFPDLI